MSHDVGAWLQRRDYNFAAKGGRDSSRSTSNNNRRKGRKGRREGKSRSRTPDKKGDGKANVEMEQSDGGQEGQAHSELIGEASYEDT
eukprot:7944796-Alexandrium_andersonii.AAC.1